MATPSGTMSGTDMTTPGTSGSGQATATDANGSSTKKKARRQR